MNHDCQFILGAQGSPEDGPTVTYCGATASIKREGVWLCAEHYDYVEDNSTPINYIAKDPVWIPFDFPQDE